MAGKVGHVYVPFTKNNQSLGFIDVKLGTDYDPIEIHIKGYYDTRNILFDSIERHMLKKGFLLKELSFPEKRMAKVVKSSLLKNYLKYSHELVSAKKMNNSSTSPFCVYQVNGYYKGNFNLNEMQCTP